MPRILTIATVLLAFSIVAIPIQSARADVNRGEQSAPPVTMDVHEYHLTPESFQLIASRALLQRNWRITEKGPNRVVGTLTKHKVGANLDLEYRVEIRLEDQKIIIGFVPNYYSERSNWLRNLEKDISVELQLQSLKN